MRIEWQEEDIKPGGVVVKRGSSEHWTIGWLSFIDNDNERYVLISHRDGMVTKPGTKGDMCCTLNNGDMVPLVLLEGW